MFGLDNNVLLGLVGVVLVFCLMTNKKSFKSLMKKEMLVIVGLTLALVCCMAKGGKVVEGFVPFDSESCRIPDISYTMGWYATHVGEGNLFDHDGTDIIINDSHSEFCNLESLEITEMQCLVNLLGSVRMGGFDNYRTIISKLDRIKERCDSDQVPSTPVTPPNTMLPQPNTMLPQLNTVLPPVAPGQKGEK